MAIYRNQIPGSFENSIFSAVVNYSDAMRKLANEITIPLNKNEYGEVEITPEMIERCHKTTIGMFGGKDGIIDQGQFEALCARPYAFFGGPLFPTVFDKAAALLEGFAHHQVFEDGNKRTGCLTAISFLDLNDYELNISNEEMYEFVMGIANNEYGVEETAQFLKDHSIHKEDRLAMAKEMDVKPNQEFVKHVMDKFQNNHPNATVDDVEEEIIGIAGEISKQRATMSEFISSAHQENPSVCEEHINSLKTYIKSLEEYTKNLEELKQEIEIEEENEQERQ